MKVFYSIILAVCISVMINIRLYADTILLSDGTYLVGKVVEWDSYHIIFKNAHGAFAIKKNQLVKLYVTAHQDEDIKLRNTIGYNMKDEDIVKHYLAGAEGIPEGGIDRERLENEISGIAPDKDIKARFSYYQTTGKLAEIIPSGLGVSLVYSQSLSPYLPDEAAFWAPHINIESEMVMFSGDDSDVNEISLLIGPEWRVRYPRGGKGYILATVMAGPAYLMIKDINNDSTSGTTSFKASVGYEYPFKNVTASLYVTYLYTYDKAAPLQGAGVSVAASYRF